MQSLGWDVFFPNTFRHCYKLAVTKNYSHQGGMFFVLFFQIPFGIATNYSSCNKSTLVTRVGCFLVFPNTFRYCCLLQEVIYDFVHIFTMGCLQYMTYYFSYNMHFNQLVHMQNNNLFHTIKFIFCFMQKRGFFIHLRIDLKSKAILEKHVIVPKEPIASFYKHT